MLPRPKRQFARVVRDRRAPATGSATSARADSACPPIASILRTSAAAVVSMGPHQRSDTFCSSHRE